MKILKNITRKNVLINHLKHKYEEQIIESYETINKLSEDLRYYKDKYLDLLEENQVKSEYINEMMIEWSEKSERHKEEINELLDYKLKYYDLIKKIEI